MPLQMAFGITVDDVRQLLIAYEGKLVNRNGRSIDALAAIIYHGLDDEDMDDIALAAMDSFIDGKPESEGAHRALRKLLMKRGVLDMSLRPNAQTMTRRHKEKADAMMAMCR
jgi:hypothetical protein